MYLIPKWKVRFILCLNEKYESFCYKKELKLLVPVDTKTNINLKFATQKTGVINQ